MSDLLFNEESAIFNYSWKTMARSTLTVRKVCGRNRDQSSFVPHLVQSAVPNQVHGRYLDQTYIVQSAIPNLFFLPHR